MTRPHHGHDRSHPTGRPLERADPIPIEDVAIEHVGNRYASLFRPQDTH